MSLLSAVFDLLGIFIGYPLFLALAACLTFLLYTLCREVERMGILAIIGIIIYIPLAVIFSIANKYK